MIIVSAARVEKTGYETDLFSLLRNALDINH